MKNWRPRFQRNWQTIAVAIVIVILSIIANAPNGSERLSGSTYSTDPQGYGAWYQMMADRGVPIARWQKTVVDLAAEYPQNTTLLQVNSELQGLEISESQRHWLEQGNTLVILGVGAPVHDIPFTKDLASPHGQVRIETTRRWQGNNTQLNSTLTLQPVAVIGDEQGAVVWSATIGAGRLIVSTTPHLAANAYQDFPANYELLATLVGNNRRRIFVDEYLHGYQDPGLSRSVATKKNAWTYLMNTPLLLAFLNLGMGLGVFIWQQNRRFGAAIVPQPPPVNNSVAYIQALGGVLRQAQSSEFVVQNIGKAEQLALQQRLGLGNKQLVDRQTLITAWTSQTNLPATDLEVLLQLATTPQRLNESELRQWLIELQALRDRLHQLSL